MSEEIIQQAKEVTEELEELNKKQQQRIGQRDALLQQLNDLGFKDTAEANQALEVLNAEFKENLEKIQAAVEDARRITEAN